MHKWLRSSIGLTLKDSALTHWFLTTPVTAKNSENFRSEVCSKDKAATEFQHQSTTNCSKCYQTRRGNGVEILAERLVCREGDEIPVKSSYYSLKRSGIKTMTDMKKSVKFGKDKVCMIADTMYLRLRAINAKKKILSK